MMFGCHAPGWPNAVSRVGCEWTNRLVEMGAYY